MPDFTQYTREDFLADESFTNYLLQKNAANVTFWQAWIRDNPQCRAEINEARLLFFLIKEAHAAAPDFKTEAAVDRQYAKLQSLLHEKASEKSNKLFQMPMRNGNGGTSRFRRLAWKAAGVAAVFLLALSLWRLFGAASNNRFETSFVPFAKTDSVAKNIILPDGSEVQLNTFSSLALEEKFNVENRAVLLTGSAFFHVHKDEAKPFDVTTGSVKTRALGTSFYIYNLHPEALSVSLLEGRVRVEGTGNYVELSPGEKAVANAGQRIFKDSVATARLSLFSAGSIHFEKADLQEIETVLEEYFNRDVVVKGTVPELNFTGSFDTKKIETILDALQFTYNLKYSLQGQTVTISFD